MGREAFLDRVWSWKEEKGGYITKQMRRLGASADWTKERFTLEPEMSDSVTEAFVRMHERGLIYKGDYLVNWSPNLQTAVSDLEVEYSEEMGKLYYFKYQLADEEGAFIPVATTRPGNTPSYLHTLVLTHPRSYTLFCLHTLALILPRTFTVSRTHKVSYLHSHLPLQPPSCVHTLSLTLTHLLTIQRRF